jgi:hypothetical protein
MVEEVVASLFATVITSLVVKVMPKLFVEVTLQNWKKTSDKNIDNG